MNQVVAPPIERGGFVSGLWWRETVGFAGLVPIRFHEGRGPTHRLPDGWPSG